MKIFLSSPGRRVELINILKNEIDNLVLIGGDYSKTSPALNFCDKSFSLNYNIDKDYIYQVLEICKKEKVELIIPLIDPELKFYSKFKNIFNKNGIDVMISSENDILMTSDKIKTYNFFKKLNFIKTPQTTLLKNFKHIEDFNEYVILKPKEGSGSKGIYKIKKKSVKSFSQIMELDHNSYIVQDFIDFDFEVTTDVFVYNKKVIELCQRKRLKTRGGEVERGITIKNEKINNIIQEIVELCDFHGVINIQIMIKNDSFYIGEINARLGGGFPLSYYAGANMIEHFNYLINSEERKEIFFDNRYKEKFYMLRYDAGIYTDVLDD